MSVKCQISFLCQNPLCHNYKLKRNDEKEYILEKYNWAEPYKCEKCNAKFYSCKWCNKDDIKENLFYRSRLSRHNQKHSKDNMIVVHRKKRSK